LKEDTSIISRNKVIELIFEIAKSPNAFDIIEERLKDLSKEELSGSIIECGMLPESFDHDSSEEKLWAKYSDILLAHSLNFLGVSAEVLRVRGNAADVFGKARNYTIIGDAKTFRLSRTAKNQKDFKIKALDDWRRSNDYAVLTSPFYQYPSLRSQIYSQAIERNVTLLSYVHLKFLLDFHTNQDLTKLWETGKRLKDELKPKDYQYAQIYWGVIDETVCSILGKKIDLLKDYKKIEIAKTKEIGQEGIKYWQNKIEEYKKLSKEEAVEKLIKAEKIGAKIETIKKVINKDFTI